MKKPFLSFFVFLNSIFLFGQIGTFQKNYYWTWPYIYLPDFTTGINIFQDNQKNYIIGVSGNYSFTYLLKTNSAGDTIWTKAYNGTEIHSFEMDQDSGYVLAGSTSDGLVIKANSAGNVQWAKIIGGTNTDVFYSIKPSFDSGYIAVGSTKSYGAGGKDIYAVRMDKQGNLLWTKTYGGTADDEGQSVLQTSDKGFLISGTYNNISIIIKTDSTGNILWNKTYSGGGAYYSIDSWYAGGYILNRGGVLTIIDTNGNPVVTKYPSSTAGGLYFPGKITNDKGYIISIAGFVDELIKMDSLLNVEWSRVFPVYDINTTMPLPRMCNVIETNNGYAFVRVADYVEHASIVLVKTDTAGAGGCDNQPSGAMSVFDSISVSVPSLSVSSGGIVNNFSVSVSPSYLRVDSSCIMTNIDEINYGKECSLNFLNHIEGIYISFAFCPDLQKGEIHIYDVLGKKIQKIKFSGNSNLFVSKDNLNNGIYFYQLLQGEKIIQKGKFAIQ